MSDKIRHKTPTDHEIRERILEVSDERRRFGFMAQYLWLGRVSEVFGKYMPTKDSYRLTTFKIFKPDETVEEVEAVMFIVKTAKRKGLLRPVALPLDEKYEPWTRLLYEYMRDNDQEYPFSLSDDPETSKKYAMTEAKKMFRGLWYPYADYTKGVVVPYKQDMVLDKRYDKKGYDEYLVELPDGSRAWTNNRETVTVNVKIEPRWKPCRSHVCRKRRNLTLAMNYKFEALDRSIIGGWTEKSQDSNVPDAQKYYMTLDLSEIDESVVEMLKMQSDRYFEKLLIPYSRLI
jgi:hypothetical protein